MAEGSRPTPLVGALVLGSHAEGGDPRRGQGPQEPGPAALASGRRGLRGQGEDPGGRVRSEPHPDLIGTENGKAQVGRVEKAREGDRAKLEREERRKEPVEPTEPPRQGQIDEEARGERSRYKEEREAREAVALVNRGGNGQGHPHCHSGHEGEEKARAGAPLRRPARSAAEHQTWIFTRAQLRA